MSHVVSATPSTEVAIAPIPLADLAPWAIFFGLLAALALFFVGADQGAVSLTSGSLLHEFVHDGRHLLAFPCH